MIQWAVFVSGQGSNLQNFLDLEKSHLKNQKLVAVVADRECQGIERARRAQKPTMILSPKQSDWTAQILKFLKKHNVDSIFLLGYMRILSPEFLSQWKGRLVNLHPSCLPSYPGLDSVKRACEAGEKYLGVSIHEVIQEVDAGRILRQISFPRDAQWNFEEAMQRVHSFEHQLVRDYLLDLEINPRS